MLSRIPVKIRLLTCKLGYARFLASRFFHCPAWGRTTRVFSFLAFSTAWHGTGLRAFSRLSLFSLPGTAPDYARFLVFSFFHCLAWGRTTRVFLSLAFSTARLTRFSNFLLLLWQNQSALHLYLLTRLSNRYIPLCIYFNFSQIFKTITCDKFTFHYVSI